MTRPLRLTLLVCLVLLTNACASSQDDQFSQREEQSLPVQDPGTVSHTVDALATTLARDLGSTQPPKTFGQPDASICTDSHDHGTDDGPFNVQGTYQIALPGPQHRPTLQRLKHQWAAAGWTHIEYRAFGGDGISADLAGNTPHDNYDVRLTSGIAPITFLRLLIITPCYRRPPTQTTGP